MKLKSLLVGAAIAFSHVAMGSTIAIIDSGVDYQHSFLKGRIWTNPVDNSANRRDEDNNGYRDDVHGWNFFGNNNEIIDYKYNDLFDSDIERFFRLQGQVMDGTIAEDELEWLRSAVKDEEFVKRLNKFGAYVHGTHVAGIAAGDNEEARILTLRLIPVDNPLLSMRRDILKALEEDKPLNFIVKQIIKGGLFLLAQSQGTVFATIGDYVNGHGADVANASLGMGMMQARMIVKPILGLAMRGQEPSPELVDELAIFFVNRSVAEQSKLAKNSAGTLFVFAAGNDGTNNDKFPVSPANIKLDNTISVGATLGRGPLAPFSNYGLNVDILAPGVSINSSIPGDLYMGLSGTSQAAPKVAGIAAQIKDENPSLNPLEIKTILMTTVDEKEQYRGLVKSGGIVNGQRAIYAAKASLELSLLDAVAEARNVIADQDAPQIMTAPELPFPMPGIF